MKHNNKVDKTVKSNGNKIDTAKDELVTSRYVRLILRWLTVAIGALVVGVIVTAITYELKLFGSDDGPAVASGWVVGIVSFFVFKNLLKKNQT